MTQINLSFQQNPSRFTLTLAGVQGPPGSSGGITDGDKGDITVSGSGAAWSINDAAITADMVAPDLIALFAPAVHGHANASGAADGFMAAADKTKLDLVAPGATANASDAALRDRATHTGAQAISTVTGLQTALDGKVASDPTGITGAFAVANIVYMTQAAYDALGSTDPATAYVLI